MKRLASYFLVAILIFWVAASADVFLDSEMPDDLQFIYQESTYMTPEGQQRIADTPGITDKLYDLLWRFVEVKDEIQIGRSLYALGKRRDLSDDQLRGIADRIRSLAVGSLKILPEDENNFIRQGIQVLSKHPSPEREDLALMLLGKDDDGIKFAAAVTLAKIGTKRSVEPVRQFLETRMQSIDPSLRAAALAQAKGSKDSLYAAQQELLARVQAAERKSTRESKSDPERSEMHRTKSADEGAKNTTTDKSGWLVWAIAIVIAIGSGLWLMQSRLTK